MNTMSNAIAICLSRLEDLNHQLHIIQEKQRVIAEELDILCKDTGTTATSGKLSYKPDCIGNLVRLLQQQSYPQNLSELTKLYEMHFEDAIPPQVVNLKTYLYRYVRRAIINGQIEEYRYSDQTRPYYVVGKNQQ